MGHKGDRLEASLGSHVAHSASLLLSQAPSSHLGQIVNRIDTSLSALVASGDFNLSFVSLALISKVADDEVVSGVCCCCCSRRLRCQNIRLDVFRGKVEREKATIHTHSQHRRAAAMMHVTFTKGLNHSSRRVSEQVCVCHKLDFVLFT